eukprot:8090658-Pyramimonas_sp.AAC.1
MRESNRRSRLSHAFHSLGSGHCVRPCPLGTVLNRLDQGCGRGPGLPGVRLRPQVGPNIAAVGLRAAGNPGRR